MAYDLEVVGAELVLCILPDALAACGAFKEEERAIGGRFGVGLSDPDLRISGGALYSAEGSTLGGAL